MLSTPFQPGRFQRCQGPGPAVTAISAGIQQGQLYIFHGTGPSQQVKTLENKANLFVAHLSELITPLEEYLDPDIAGGRA